MTCPVRDFGQAIERLQTEWDAASTPAGRFPTSATTHSARRGQDHDPDNRGRSAHVFEQFNEEQCEEDEFRDEVDALHVIGVWAMFTVIFGGIFVSAHYLHPYINQFFAWLGL